MAMTIPEKPAGQSRSEWALVLLLRMIAVASALAVVPVFMPHHWMDRCHRLLGLGDLPEMPVLVYLTRSLSALYVVLAGLLWITSQDLRRYDRLVAYLGSAFLLFGLVTLWIDLRASLPWYWTAVEAPALVLFGLAILALRAHIQRSNNRQL
jgi:hypothetical protein